MSISASDVAKLRKLTGAGMMDCKKALVESEGDFDRAIQIIREKGQAVANKRADREASEGDVIAKVSADGKYGALIALNCETDFVAKNEDFVKLAHEICDLALATKPANLDALKNTPFKNGKTVEGIITEQIGIIGEKLELACCESLAGEVVCPYIHMGNKLATLVSFNQAGVDKQVYKDVAMQVAAMRPLYLDRDEVPSEVLEKEKEILKEQAENEGLDKSKIEMIVNGRINKYYEEVCLVDQGFIKENKMKVSKYVESKKSKIISFVRYEVGEGMEKREENFADEVMKQING